MRRQWLAAGAFAGLALAPFHAQAFEIVGKRLEIYGQAHVSVDMEDSDTNHSIPGTRGNTTSGAEFGVSSNSSRLGFRGIIPLGTEPALSALYQFEQELNVDRGGGDTWGTRNSFIGLGTAFGDLLFGYYDTAFKVIGEDFTIWGDTIADRRSILGASPFNGNRMDVRYKNVAMYRFKSDQLLLMGQYSSDSQGDPNGHNVDLNNNNSFSFAGEYKGDFFAIGAGIQRDRKDLAVGNKTGTSTFGARVGASVKFDPIKASLIYEHVSTKANVATVGGRPTGAAGSLDRDAIGGSAQFYVTKQFYLGTQILHAFKVGGTRDTAATMYSVGAWYDVNKWASFYLIGAMTNNDRNARYALADAGHGDRISTDFGKDPRSISLGMVFKF